MADIVSIGIDPGKSGALAIRWPDGAWEVHDCPTSPMGNKMLPCPAGMAELLDIPPGNNVHAYIEKVGAMPGQGVTSMFSFGQGYGMWLGVLAALKIPHTLVTPQRWKKAMLSGMPKGKGASLTRARQLFPASVEHLTRKKDEGRAEAMLIAEHGRRELTVGGA